MPKSSGLSLRTRLLLLVLLAVLPVSGLTIYNAVEQRRQAATVVQTNALQLARLAAVNQEQLIGGAQLNRLAAQAELPAGSSVNVIDQSGTILARYPDPEKWVGQSVAQTPLFRTILDHGDQGTALIPDIDGVVQIFGFTALHTAPGGGTVYLGVGIPTEAAFAPINRTLIRSLAGLGLVAALALAATWVSSDLFLVRRVKALVHATQQLAAGDLGARIGLPQAGTELDQLAHAFDQMAGALKQRAAEQARAEDALRQAKDQLQTVLDALPTAVSWISSDLKYLGANKYLAETLRLPAEAVIGQDVGFLRASPDLAAFARDFFASPAQQASREINSEVNGAVRRYLAVARKYQGGQAAAFVGMDVTERRRAEEEIRKLNADLERRVVERTAQLAAANEELHRENAERRRVEAALRASEERLRLLFEQANDAIFIENENDEILDVNSRACVLLGYSRAELLRLKIPDLQAPEVRGRLGSVIEGELARGNRVFEAINLHRDGTRIPVEVTTARIVGSEAGIVLSIVRDVTERKRAEAEIQRALAQEQELSELKSRFIAMTSHEFRTPLSVILSSVQLLEEYEQQFARERKLAHLRRIQAAVKRMADLLSDLLTIGQAEAGKLPFKPAYLDLERFCRELAEELQLTTGPDYTIAFTGAGPCSEAYVDEHLLRQILSNLFSNAIKYSPPGGTIGFELACSDDQATFRISDQGIGIPAEDQKRLFETFHRANNVGNIPGTGLGLAIAKRSVDLHGGTITVASQVGSGTTVTVTLPTGPGVV